jgi:hypothetical protein
MQPCNPRQKLALVHHPLALATGASGCRGNRRAAEEGRSPFSSFAEMTVIPAPRFGFAEAGLEEGDPIYVKAGVAIFLL